MIQHIKPKRGRPYTRITGAERTRQILGILAAGPATAPVIAAELGVTLELVRLRCQRCELIERARVKREDGRSVFEYRVRSASPSPPL